MVSRSDGRGDRGHTGDGRGDRAGMTYPTVIIPCDSGWTFAGTVPVALCRARKATAADWMAGRAHTLPDGREIVLIARVYADRQDAADAAWTAGVAVDCPTCGEPTADPCPCRYADDIGYVGER